MTTKPNYPKFHRHDTKSLLRSLIVAIIALLFVMLVTGCSMTVNPDGSRTYSLDGEQAAKAIIIYTK